MESFTLTKRSVTVSISVVTPKIEATLMMVAEKFKHHGLELEKEEMDDNPRGSVYTFSLGDKQEDEACQLSYYFGQALGKEFAKIQGVFKLINKKLGWEISFNEIEGLRLLREWNDAVKQGMAFEFAGLNIDPKDEDIEMTII